MDREGHDSAVGVISWSRVDKTSHAGGSLLATNLSLSICSTVVFLGKITGTQREHNL